jgi:hypothetical protein
MINTRRMDYDTVAVDCTGGCGHTLYVPLTEEQETRWRSGALIQKVIPEVDEAMRELLISGICPTCWDEIYGDDE